MNDVCKETNSFGPRAGGKGIKPSSAFRLLPGLSSQYHLFCQKPKTGVPGSSMPPIQKTHVLTTLKQTNCHLTYTNINILHVTCLPVICTQAQENRLLLRKQTKTFYARDKQKPSMRTTSPTYVTRLNVFMHKPRHPRTTSASRQGLGRRHVRQTGI